MHIKFILIIGFFLISFSCRDQQKYPLEAETANCSPKIETKLPKIDSTIYTSYWRKEWKFIQKDSLVCFPQQLEHVHIDIRYATEDNFFNKQIYSCAECYVKQPVAMALLDVLDSLQQLDLSLILYDCYRPSPFQQVLWDAMPNASYVAPPWKGSMHSKGFAVDLGIGDKQGNPLDFGSDYDQLDKTSYHSYTAFSDTILANRNLLKTTMEKNGFRAIRSEWWHYNFPSRNAQLMDWVWDCD